MSQKVLLCSAWVDSGEYLAAAARLVVQCQAEVFGIACVRFEQNCRCDGGVSFARGLAPHDAQHSVCSTASRPIAHPVPVGREQKWTLLSFVSVRASFSGILP